MPEPSTESPPPTRPTGGAPIHLCDHPGCDAVATYRYLYAWGQEGYVCSQHVLHKQQIAKNTKRSVSFTAINPGAAPDMTRDERTKLKAQMLVAQEERDENATRAQQLYRMNQDLAASVQRSKLIETELKAQIRDLSISREQTEAKLADRERQLAEASDELGRLRVIADGISLSPTVSDS